MIPHVILFVLEWSQVVALAAGVASNAGVILLIYVGAVRAYKDAYEAEKQKRVLVEEKLKTAQGALAIALINEETLRNMKGEDMELLRQSGETIRALREIHLTDQPPHRTEQVK